MVNFGLLTAEICWRVWGTPANFNGFRVLAALLHGTLVYQNFKRAHDREHTPFWGIHASVSSTSICTPTFKCL